MLKQQAATYCNIDNYALKYCVNYTVLFFGTLGLLMISSTKTK
ncbi:hypothetical protein DFQ09_102216 [Winogradskyella pacifica]|uniref:Uncharacterized protein n=1 Tax=Winogradskyella pacifica TaxID=664642 RepID=A0A3D9MZ64_9FLAO|nr:hypothetical protein DFQ09_102216 [Winogradskyella pacifica]